MDDHTDTPASPDSSSRPYLKLLGPPLVIVVAGLLMTAIAAQSLGQQSREYSKRMFEAQHASIVNAVSASLDLDPGTPRFISMFADRVPDRMSVRIDTLDKHTKTPILEVNTGQPPAQDSTLRSEVALAGEHWLITSTPDTAIFEQPARKSAVIAWTSGSMLSIFAAFVCILVTIKWHRQIQQSSAIRSEYQTQSQKLKNLQTEKRVLRQALDDSEQRSRDLVSLSGAIMCQLDEEGKMGFVSAGVADVLGFAPADLSGVEAGSLITENDRGAFDKTLQAAREDRHLQRIDLSIVDADRQPVIATIRVIALHDTLHGFSGFRLSVQPRPDLQVNEPV